MKKILGTSLLLFLFLGVFSQETSGLLGDYDYPEENGEYKSLQSVLRNLKEGDSIVLAPGVYTGPCHITVPNVVIDGQNKVTVSGMDNESVLYLDANHITVKNMNIVHSGDSPDKIDAAVRVVKSDYCRVENCRIDECLFGIDLSQSNHCVISHNEITSIHHKPLALKGDAIRLWYSTFNTIRNNYWHGVRDMVVWYSSENHLLYNMGVGNRYSIHFMYSHNNRIHKNRFYKNSVGIFLMYSELTIITNNLVEGSVGSTGMCLGMKETSSNQILNNRFIYSAYGIHFDVSPFVAEKVNTIQGNEIAFCNVGLLFHSDIEGNEIIENSFHNNLTQVYTRGKTASLNKFDRNYWDDYQGFDRDKDNIGDMPYKLYSYSEHLWSFNKNVKFFYGAPILAVLDFLERLAPFSKPKFVLKDKHPVYIWKEKKTDSSDTFDVLP